MKIVELGNITLQVDQNKTKEFYAIQNGFVCDCPHCINYVNRIPDVLNSLNGIDKELGIDLNKDVGQGMDELMSHDYDNYHLYVIPYYVIGKELKKEISEPICSNIKRVENKLTQNLSLKITNKTEGIKIENAENVLTIWLEYKTKLIKK